jgi:hypothetical protein
VDADRFDHITRTLSTRRTALAGLLAGSLVLLGVAEPEEGAAHNPLAVCKRLPTARQRRRCTRRARAHTRTCHHQPLVVTCASGCGVRTNNCGRATACPCPPGRNCLGNGSCAETCTTDSCPAGCFCPELAFEDEHHCTQSTPCEQTPQSCTSTAQCPTGSICTLTICSTGPMFATRCVPLCPN